MCLSTSIAYGWTFLFKYDFRSILDIWYRWHAGLSWHHLGQVWRWRSHIKDHSNMRTNIFKTHKLPKFWSHWVRSQLIYTMMPESCKQSQFSRVSLVHYPIPWFNPQRQDAGQRPTLAHPAAPLATGVTKISSVDKTNKNWLPRQHPLRIEELTSEWSSTAIVLPTLKIWQILVQ